MTYRGLMHCRVCQGQTSVTAGTVFEGTRKPLRTWFLAMWFITSQKNGASALGLQRVLGLGSYRTAWTWLHKLRLAMVRPGLDRLHGIVEVDEMYVGGPEEGVHGRQTESKAIVVVAAEKRGRGLGRIRVRRLDDVSGDSLLPFVEAAVRPGSKVHTDGWPGYSGLQKLGYRHQITNISRSEKLAHQLLPRVHRVAALLKRWLVGTHHGGVQHTHLDYCRVGHQTVVRRRLSTAFRKYTNVLKLNSTHTYDMLRHLGAMHASNQPLSHHARPRGGVRIAAAGHQIYVALLSSGPGQDDPARRTGAA